MRDKGWLHHGQSVLPANEIMLRKGTLENIARMKKQNKSPHVEVGLRAENKKRRKDGEALTQNIKAEAKKYYKPAKSYQKSRTSLKFR